MMRRTDVLLHRCVMATVASVLLAWAVSLSFVWAQLPGFDDLVDGRDFGRRRFQPAQFDPDHLESKCPACDFTSIREPTSTPRDAVLAAALTQLKRVVPFIRTLRMTGTRARVILFLDKEATATEEWRRFFGACDVEPVFVRQVNAVVESAPKLSRYYFYQQWLSIHIEEVDRVLHTDTFDVIFQSDPFFEGLNPNKLYFTVEPVTLRESHWTRGWMEQCYPHAEVKRWLDRGVSCSGVTVGGARAFLTYLGLLLGAPKWVSCFGHSLDQAHHNYQWFSGAFDAAGLEIEELGCDSLYLTMAFCCKRVRCDWRGPGQGVIYGNSTVAPALVHQYNRWKNLTARNDGLCPGDVIARVKEHAPANVEALPPLETVFPDKTLWPPGMEPH